MTDKPDVWFPLVVGDYLKDTARLTTEQHGAYLLLLMDYWTNGPPLDDDAELAGITKLERRHWKAMRPKLLRFFTIVDGHWRQKRIDVELINWTERKRKFAERAAAGGRAKAAKSSASSTPQALLKGVLTGCTSSSSTGVEGPSGHSTPCGQNDFLGPKEVRQAFVDAKGDDWTRSYLDPCGWQDVPERALIPRNGVAGAKLVREGRKVLAEQNLTVIERAA